MGEHTIKATWGLDTKPAKESVDDLKRHVEQRSREIKGLISGGAGAGGAAPSGGNGAGPTRPPSGGGGSGIASLAGTAAGFIGGITALVGSELIARIGQIASRFMEARKEAEELETRIHGISLAANQSGKFQGIEEIRSDLGKAVQESDELKKKLDLFKLGRQGNVSAAVDFAAEAALHGKTSGAFAAEIEEKRKTAQRAASEDITKIAGKMSETLAIEHERFSVSEQQAAITTEEQRHAEALKMLSDEANRTGKQNLATTNAENELYKERTRDLTTVRDAAQADLNLSEQRSQIANRALSPRREAVELAHAELKAARENLAIEEKIGGVRAQNARIRVNQAAAAATAADLENAGPMQPGEMAQRRATINKAGARLELLRSKQKAEGFDQGRQDEIDRLNQMGLNMRQEDIEKTQDNSIIYGLAGEAWRNKQSDKAYQDKVATTPLSQYNPSAAVGEWRNQQQKAMEDYRANQAAEMAEYNRMTNPHPDAQVGNQDENSVIDQLGIKRVTTPKIPFTVGPGGGWMRGRGGWMSGGALNQGIQPPLEPPAGQPAATPSGLPSPTAGGGDVADKIAAVMDKYWGRA